MEYLRAYASDGNAFSLWVIQFPELAQRVEQDLVLLDKKRDATTYVDLVAARDAAHRLCQAAYQGGFVDLGNLFYGYYEKLCYRLCGWLS